MDDADLGSVERAFLERARQGLSPTPAQLLNVRRSLEAAVAATALGATASAARAAGAAKGASAGWASKLVLVVATAAAAGTTGYWAGYRAARRETPPIAEPARSAPSDGQPAIAPVPSIERDPPPPEPKSHPRVTPASRRAANAAPAGAARANDDREASLANEVRGLRSVERALREQRPGLALALLARLDREVPGGRLAEEREATAVIAHCALGDGPLGIDLAADFAEGHPSSVYLERVRQSCATGRAARGQTDRSPSGD
jgi:hypothetical protein